ncbi:MAG: hypothetical protein AB3N06_02320 [Erythrobacter sp.]
MRRSILPAILATLVLPAPALAQDAAGTQAAPLAELGEQMRDPERQRETALMAQAMTEVLLDMPIGPLAEAAAELASGQARRIDPDVTLRRLAPQTDGLGEGVARNVPRAMQAAGAMARGLATMTPMMRELAGRVRLAIPLAD